MKTTQAISQAISSPVATLPRAAGTYTLLMELRPGRRLLVGRMGDHDFASGYYLYVGSAHGPGGLRARIARHIKAAWRAARHWHLDYLLPHCALKEVWWTSNPAPLECRWAGLLALLGSPQPPRFGASDCRCPGHLLLLAQGLDPLDAFNHLRAETPGDVRRLILPLE
jgi:Uri superfamily endonuclease